MIAIVRNMYAPGLVDFIDTANRHDLHFYIQLKSATNYIKAFIEKWNCYAHTENLHKEILSLDNCKSTLIDKFKQRNLGTPDDAKILLKNYNQITIKCPDYIRYHQIKITYNALLTAHRYNATLNRNPEKRIPDICPFCIRWQDEEENI